MAAGMNLSLEALGVNLPYSMEAEQAVLGAAILDDVGNIPKMVEALRPEMFYARQNGEIFSEIVRLFTAGAPVDFVTLLAAVQDAGHLRHGGRGKGVPDAAGRNGALAFTHWHLCEHHCREIPRAPADWRGQNHSGADGRGDRPRAAAGKCRAENLPNSRGARLLGAFAHLQRHHRHVCPFAGDIGPQPGKISGHPHRVPLFGHHAHGALAGRTLSFWPPAPAWARRRSP